MIIALATPLKVTKEELRTYFPNYFVVELPGNDIAITYFANAEHVPETKILHFYKSPGHGFNIIRTDLNYEGLEILLKDLPSEKYHQFKTALRFPSEGKMEQVSMDKIDGPILPVSGVELDSHVLSGAIDEWFKGGLEIN